MKVVCGTRDVSRKKYRLNTWCYPKRKEGCWTESLKVGFNWVPNTGGHPQTNITKWKAQQKMRSYTDKIYT